MGISRFDEGALGSNLTLYYNATEMPPEVTAGTDVDYIDPAYAGKGPRLTQRDVTDRVTYDPAIKIGELNSWQVYDGGIAGLKGSLPLTTESCAVVVVQRANSTYTSNRWSYSLMSGPTSNLLGYRAYWGSDGTGDPSYTQHTNIIGSGAKLLKGIRYNLDEPIIYILNQKLDGDVDTYVKDSSGGAQVYTTNHSAAERTFSEFLVGTNPNYNGGYGGEQGIFAVYNRQLTGGEIVDLQNLCQHWIDVGAEPEISYPPSTSFGPVLTNDLSPQCVLEWQWASSVTGTWVNVDDATAGLASLGVTHTIATEAISGTSQTGNKLLINSASSARTIVIRCLATTPYNTDGLPTTAAVLTIVEATV